VIALLGVEVRRLLARRLVRLFGLLTLLGILIAGLVVFIKAPAGFSVHDFRNVFAGTTAPIVLTAWVVGASFVGAEWHAGTMAMTLTWEPRRTRLLLAKLVAVVAFAFLATVVVQALLGLALTPGALRSPPERVFFGCRGCVDEGASLAAAAAIVLRGATLSAVLAALGFALASIGRNTAASVGVGFGYLLVVEGLLAGLVSWLRPILIAPNAIVFVGGEPLGEVGLRSATAAGLLLAAYGAAATLAALGAFKARDVT
jgi:hypothetical protein